VIELLTKDYFLCHSNHILNLFVDCCDGIDEYYGKIRCLNTCMKARKDVKGKLLKLMEIFLLNKERFSIDKQEREHAFFRMVIHVGGDVSRAGQAMVISPPPTILASESPSASTPIVSTLTHKPVRLAHLQTIMFHLESGCEETV
jgi:hypothetical protein